jgi:hypothetical protein
MKIDRIKKMRFNLSSYGVSHPLRKTNAVPPLVERHFLFVEHQARLNDRKIKMPTSAAAAIGLTVPPKGINEITPTLSFHDLIQD